MLRDWGKIRRYKIFHYSWVRYSGVLLYHKVLSESMPRTRAVKIEAQRHHTNFDAFIPISYKICGQKNGIMLTYRQI